MISLVSLSLWMAAHSAPVEQPAPTFTPAATAALQDPAPAGPKWTGSVNVGGIATSGNSQTTSGNATADAEYRREKDRVTLGFLWLYSENRSNPTGQWELIDRKTSGRAKYDYFFSTKTYGLVQASMESDWAANIDLRSTLGVGLGRQFVESAKVKFSGEIGVSEVIEDVDVPYNTAPNGDGVNEGQSLREATTLEWNINETWALAHTLELYESLDDFSDMFGHSDLSLKVTLTKSMLASAGWVFDYDNTPAAGKERADNRYLLSLGWKF